MVTILVDQKKIRCIRFEARRPWLNFEHDPAVLVCSIRRIWRRLNRLKGTSVSRTTRLSFTISFCLLTLPNHGTKKRKSDECFVHVVHLQFVWFHFQKFCSRSCRNPEEEKIMNIPIIFVELSFYTIVWREGNISRIPHENGFPVPSSEIYRFVIKTRTQAWFIISTRIRQTVLRNYSCRVAWNVASKVQEG